MGRAQEANGAECAAIAHALETAARRRNKLDHLTIFTDAQAAIWRMTSDDPGLGQRYAIAARKHIAELRGKEPGIWIEIRWCPSHCGVGGNEIADEWAKQAADEPDARGVEWHRYIDRCGRRAHKPAPLPTPNASASRPSGQTPASGSRHNSPEQATANPGLATSKSLTRPWLKRTRSSLRGSTNSRRDAASRDSSCSGPREGQAPSAGGVTTRPKHESICSRTAGSGKASRRLCGRWSEKKPAGAKTGSRSRSSSPTRDAARRS